MEKAPIPENQTSVFVVRKRTFTLVFLGVSAVFAISSVVTDYNVIDGFVAIPRAVSWIAENFVPDKKAWSRFPNILEKLIETALLSVAVTVCAAVCALFSALLGTKTTKINPWIGRGVRIVAAFFRNVPDVVWAILLLFSFGQNILTGFFALFFYTFGVLTRTFIETIDEVSANCVEALRATGANLLQTVFQGILPSSAPEIVSWILYMIETNIRNSTLIGVLTATGIGYMFDLYYKRMDYGSAGLVVISIVALVILIETISNQIRKAIM
ncbi:MAG: phosphonate ABC transporter, permease protein PhnE [Clostridiales Family XIII bacterium]|jgi:phosphonate transport system permease protein|nr:phosphonate ABC transporter, permease protein PhnE [Clostridiales Family XIII bacterium]